jgi:FMN reductase
MGGTARPNSSSGRALVMGLEAAERCGAEVDLLTSADLHLPIYDPTRAMPDSASKLLETIRRADGLIVASPGYHGGVSGLVKNALDYLEELREDHRPYLSRRAVGCIVCASGWQSTATTLVSMRSTVHALRGWPTPLGVTINSRDSVADRTGTISESVQEQLTILGQEVTEFAVRFGRLLRANDLESTHEPAATSG